MMLRKIKLMTLLVMRIIVEIKRTTEGNNDGNWNNIMNHDKIINIYTYKYIMYIYIYDL